MAPAKVATDMNLARLETVATSAFDSRLVPALEKLYPILKRMAGASRLNAFGARNRGDADLEAVKLEEAASYENLLTVIVENESVLWKDYDAAMTLYKLIRSNITDSLAMPILYWTLFGEN